MGDRGNIVVLDGIGRPGPNSEGVVLYTHWGGYRVQQTLARTLQRGERVGDAEYFTRILFVDLMLDSVVDDRNRSGRDVGLVHDSRLLAQVLGNSGFGIGIRTAGDVENDVPLYSPATGCVAVVPVEVVRESNGKPSTLAQYATENDLWVPVSTFIAAVLADAKV